MRSPFELLRGLLPTVLLLALGACAAPAPAPTEPPLHLIVLHTNDVHGQLVPRREEGGLRRLATRVAEIRAGMTDDQELLFVDGGDWYQGTPEGRVGLGHDFLALMTMLDFDAMAVGNHELDFGVAHLEELLAAHPLPSVCANVVDPTTGDLVPWGGAARIVERGGVRIAMIGLLATDTPAITHPSARELDFLDPVESFRRARADVASESDLTIALTHIGHHEDERLARETGVPLVVGGHSHWRLEEGIRVGDSLVVQAGAKARHLGRVDLWIARGGERHGEVLRSTATLLPLEERGDETLLPAGFAEACDALAEQAARDMDTVIGTLNGPLDRKSGRVSSSTSGNLICDVFRARSGAQVAVHNKGGIRTRLDAGPVTRRDLFELLPFDNSLVVLDLSGAELTDAIRRGVGDPEHSGIEVSGVHVRVEEPGVANSPLIRVDIDGAPIDPDARYRVATNSFLARGGDDYFDEDVVVEVDTGLLLREILEDAIAAAGDDGVTPPDDERFLGRP